MRDRRRPVAPVVIPISRASRIMDLRSIQSLLAEDDGAAASEYAIAVALIAVVVASAVGEFFEFDQVYVTLNSILSSLLN